MVTTGALGWRMDLLPVHVDDAFDRVHQKPLGLGVVLGDDHEALADIFTQTGHAGRHRQIQDRDGCPTNIRHTAHHRVGLGHHGQVRALQHLPHLEHVDPVQLLAIEAEQQQFETVLPYQLCALVNRIHYTSHARLLDQMLERRTAVGTRLAFLTV